MSRLIHYSQEEFEFDRDHQYTRAGGFKPKGFWVSVEGPCDWDWWCRQEDFADMDSAIPYEVKLSPSANVLMVTTLDDIDRLDVTLTGGSRLRRETLGPLSLPSYLDPDWGKVISQHDGVIIAPYQYGRRYEYSWYYGWDCASGVIWNLNAIQSVTRLPTPTAQFASVGQAARP